VNERRAISIPAALSEDDVVVIIDSREALPYDFPPGVKTVRDGLQTGDYSLRGLEEDVVVERKSLEDFVMCCGAARERFQRELDRLRAIPRRLLVLEATWDACATGGWRGIVTPSQVTGSILAWSTDYIPILLAGSREAGMGAAWRFLFGAARREHARLRKLLAQAAAPREESQEEKPL
jgi:ERCC4-type nuclease